MANRLKMAMLQALVCPLPRSDRIFGRVLPNWYPIAEVLLHREFGKRASRHYLAPRSKDFYRTPRLPRTFRARMISDFRGASSERGRATLVFPQRDGMERDC